MYRSTRALAGPAALLVAGGLLLGLAGRWILLDEANPVRLGVLGVGLLFSIVGTHAWYVVRDRQRLLRRLACAGASCAGIVRRVVHSRRIVEYEYSAGDGSRHVGRTQTLEPSRLAGLDDGATVTVIYDARCPGSSVLDLER